MNNSINILVTGSNGQLGNEMRLLGADSTDHYIFTDVAELDITNSEAVSNLLKEQSIDVIVNCAAYTAVDRAEEDENTALQINGTAVKILAECAQATGAALIHVSTDYVFDGTATEPYRESDPVHPTGAYGRTKLAGEEAVVASGCRYLILRTAWLYSEFGNNFVKTMLRLTAERSEISVVNDQYGTPTYAGDLARAIVQILDRRTFRTRQGIYHYTDEGACTWWEFATQIARMAGHTQCIIHPCTSEQYPSKVKRPAYSVLDKSRTRHELEVETPDWHDSLELCLKKLIPNA